MISGNFHSIFISYPIKPHSSKWSLPLYLIISSQINPIHFKSLPSATSSSLTTNLTLLLFKVTKSLQVTGRQGQVLDCYNPNNLICLTRDTWRRYSLPVLQTLQDKGHRVQHAVSLQRSQATNRGTTRAQLPTAQGEDLGPLGTACDAKHKQKPLSD